MGIRKEMLEEVTQIESIRKRFMVGRVYRGERGDGGYSWSICGRIRKGDQELERWTKIDEEGVKTIRERF